MLPITVVGAANDQIPANVFINPQNQATMEKVAEDVFAGIELANLVLIMNGQKPVYCIAGGAALTGSQIIELTREVISGQPGWANLPWGLSFMLGLNSTFPCSQGNTQSARGQCPADAQIFIDPRLVPRRTPVSREQFDRTMAFNHDPEVRKRVMEDYYAQGQPIAVPFQGGTVMIDPHNPCIQQYVGR